MTAFLRDKRNPVILLLSALVLIRIPQEDPRFAFWVFGGILLSCLFDLFTTAILRKKWIIPKSAAISGFIVFGILDYHEPFRKNPSRVPYHDNHDSGAASDNVLKRHGFGDHAADGNTVIGRDGD